ncbi:MAG: hypothetical protein COT92_00065 [Candidatus Doudnabacteria bacterium CG10_big_fil_rev_8_21_14_0_10_42_18]|uniref:DNA polymerase III subunit delta n=1 Tax=Candidatus Doudnabacteria bacterium CG10_big_fil_rev_8_21_14_0_10_42_18 TaxID=1974552 RepID=A0A2H0VC20_9BACT|nr:MAG: hypothetical protein COT92_00065 [Candidatus Doudnabacteria bacterium CG10_big_fil_rev_8_21_14_0_10_42_18]
MEIWKTFGHQNVKNILETQLKAGIYPHAYLFSGRKGVLKQNLAMELAEKILGGENLPINPDFQILQEEGEIVLSKIHEFISRMRLMPVNSGYKVGIINSCENLNQQSSNALLKILEEPSQSSIIILVANNKNILPTLRSRCQVLNFNPLTVAQLKEFATQSGLEFSEEAALLSFGSMQKFMEFSQDKESLNTHKRNSGVLNELRDSTMAEKILKISEFAEKDAPELEEIFTDWLFWQRHKLAGSPKQYPSIKHLLTALEHLKTNKNKKLILQELFLAL